MNSTSDSTVGLMTITTMLMTHGMTLTRRKDWNNAT